MQAATPTTQFDGAVWRDHYASPQGRRWWPCAALVRALATRERMRVVVEAGCGNGANLWLLAEHAEVTVGLDGSAEALRLANDYIRKRHISDMAVRLRQCDVREIEMGDGSADGVVDVMTGQHVRWTERERLYAEYRRVLRRGGWLFTYHLGMGTTVGEARHVPGQPWMVMNPALFPDAGETALPPAWALRDRIEGAGFKVTSAEVEIRIYPDGKQAVYHVMQGEAV